MQISATDMLRAFHRDETHLFIGAASVTVGLLVVGFQLIRRRFDRLLSFFAWFAVLYGERLWLQVVDWTADSAPNYAGGTVNGIRRVSGLEDAGMAIAG